MIHWIAQKKALKNLFSFLFSLICFGICSIGVVILGVSTSEKDLYVRVCKLKARVTLFSCQNI